MAIDYEASNLPVEQRHVWRSHEEFSRCSNFIPNRAQFDFIRAIGMAPESEAIVYYDSSANGQGKTANLMNILANIIYPHGTNIYDYVRDVQTGEEWTGFFDWPLYERWPEGWPKQFWYICEASLLNKVVMPEFKKWFVRDTYSEAKEGKHYVSKVEFPESGWEGYFLTRDQDPLVFEGGNVGVWIGDEPGPEWQYNSAHMRIRNGGIIINSATPILESGWMDDRIKRPAEEGDPKYYYQSTDIWNNSISRGGEWDLGPFGIQKKGNLTDQKVQDMIDTCDPDEAPARLWGKGLHLSGRIIKIFDNQKHVVPARDVAADQIWFVVDPHDAKPPFAQWWAVSGKSIEFKFHGDIWETNLVRCVCEYPAYEKDRGYETISDTRLTVSDFCAEMLEIEEEWGFKGRIAARIMDPRFGNKEITLNNKRMTVQGTYAENGINCILAPATQIGYGENLIKEYLRAGAMTIEEHCINTWRAYLRYSWVKPRTARDDKDVASETRQRTEKFKHAIDTTRYFLTMRPQYQGIDRYKPRDVWDELREHMGVSEWDPMAA